MPKAGAAMGCSRCVWSVELWGTCTCGQENREDKILAGHTRRGVAGVRAVRAAFGLGAPCVRVSACGTRSPRPHDATATGHTAPPGPYAKWLTSARALNGNKRARARARRTPVREREYTVSAIGDFALRTPLPRGDGRVERTRSPETTHVQSRIGVLCDL